MSVNKVAESWGVWCWGTMEDLRDYIGPLARYRLSLVGRIK